MTNQPFAVFLVAVDYPWVAATTRPDGGYGLPGGKVDPGEHPIAALRRECAEEGWMVSQIAGNPCHKATVDGKEVWWYRADHATRMEKYKEQGRIEPFWVDPNMLKTGLGNEFVISMVARADCTKFWEDHWKQHDIDMLYSCW